MRAMDYDSRQDTLDHIAEVSARLQTVADELHKRAADHDASKLEEPEKSAFDEFSPLLAQTTYGSEEYKRGLDGLGPAIEHHYCANRHHPEHWPNGIRDMNLIDVIEMLADWKAASLRHPDGNLQRSIEINRARFGFGEEIFALLMTTARDLGWL